MIASTSSTDSSRLSLLHVLAPGPAGGLESVVASLAIGQKARGHGVQVVSVVGRGDAEPGLHRRLRAGGVEPVIIEVPPRAYSTERREYGRLFSSLKSDVVHTHGYRPDVLASGVAGRLRIPRVTTVHGFTGGDWKNRLYEFLQIRAFKRYEAVVAVSRPLEARLRGRGVPGRSLHMISNGYDASQAILSRAEARSALGLPQEANVLGWVGRLSPEKGPDIMVGALAALQQPETVLSIIGDGQERSALEAQARDLGVAAQLRWHGMVPDAGRLYRAFDAFVLSSRTEGTPISLFEAMAAGVPVVATSVGGVPDVLRETEGWLVLPGDAQSLAKTIARALDKRGESRRRSESAHQRVFQVYGLDPWLDQYDRLYRSLLSSRTN